MSAKKVKPAIPKPTAKAPAKKFAATQKKSVISGKKTASPAVPPIPVKAPQKKKSVKQSPIKAAESSVKPAELRQEEIALRAYFLSEKRWKEGKQGEQHDDWLEAVRQLSEEKSAEPNPKSKPKRSGR